MYAFLKNVLSEPMTINPLELDKRLNIVSTLPQLCKDDGYNMPAVYAWRDADTNEIVYIGKALRVRNRLMSHWYQATWMIQWIQDGAVPVVDVWLVDADKRASIERMMLDAYHPRYNMRLD